MKKIFILLLTVLSSGLVNASHGDALEVHDSQKKINVHIINKDIGIIRDGNFPEDQKLYVKHSSYIGKDSCQNLFNVEECYSLRNLIPDFSISKEGETKQAFRGNPLKLPGEKNYQMIPWGLNNNIAGKLSILPSLIVYKYQFTSKGWNFVEEVDLIKQGTKLELNLNGKSNDITIEYFWPGRVKSTNLCPLYMDVKAYVGKPQFGKKEIEFVENWREGNDLQKEQREKNNCSENSKHIKNYTLVVHMWSKY